MKKLICAFALVFGVYCASDAAFTSCGPGYVLASHSKIDGIPVAECQKLWCRDLENGRVMGSGDMANSGYESTVAPVTLCDARNNCVDCFGQRKWCKGETVGEWNPGIGVYTKNGDDVTYLSEQNGNCFAWQLENHDCAKTGILIDGKWVCATAEDKNTNISGSSKRRTSTMRRVRRLN